MNKKNPEKTITLITLIYHQDKEDDIFDKIYLYDKDPYEPKYQYLNNKCKMVGLKHFNYSNAFIVYSNDIQDVYKNIDEYNPEKKHKVLIVFDDMVVNMIRNKKINPTITELFIRGRKLNTLLVFIA